LLNVDQFLLKQQLMSIEKVYQIVDECLAKMRWNMVDEPIEVSEPV